MDPWVLSDCERISACLAVVDVARQEMFELELSPALGAGGAEKPCAAATGSADLSGSGALGRNESDTTSMSGLAGATSYELFSLWSPAISFPCRGESLVTG